MRPSEREKMLAKARKVRERKQSTYDEVPSGRLTSRVQKAKDALDGRKGAKATSGTVLTFKDTGSGKGPDPKGLFKPRPKTQANRAKSQGGRSAAEVAANKKAKDPRGNQIKATPGKAKSAAKTWKDYSSIASAKAAGSLYYNKGGKKMAAVTKSDLDKSGLSLTAYMNYKTGKTAKAAPKKAASKKTGMSTGNTVAGTKSTKKAAPKSKDPRTGFASKATPGKAKGALPAGALRTFTSGRGYNNKTEVLRKVNGKTYVFKKGK